MTHSTPYASLVAAVLVTACGPASDRQPAAAPTGESAHVVSAVIRDSRLVARDTVTAGWTTMQIRDGDGGGHNLVGYRLDDGVSVETFLAALDTVKGIPLGALALGGPEEAEPDVTMHLAPGRIVLTCLMRDAQKRRHAAHGESQLLHVVAPEIPSDTGTAPTPTVTVSMTDFAYPGVDTWPAGTHTIAVTNDGAAEHLVTLTRLLPGKTLRDYATSDSNDGVGEYLGGIARMGPGRSATMRLQLSPGDYVLTCLVTDPRTGQPHFELGMVKLVHVVAAVAEPRT